MAFSRLKVQLIGRTLVHKVHNRSMAAEPNDILPCLFLGGSIIEEYDAPPVQLIEKQRSFRVI
jgi:hypothetical protein